MILTSLTEEPCSCVYVDDVEESRKMVNYLIQKGHRKIALVTTPDHLRMLEVAKDGYLKALRENGIEQKEELIRRMDKEEKEFSISSGYDVVSRLLKDGVDFTAVYACSDYAAIGACKAIFDAGKSVPEDYSAQVMMDWKWRYYHPEIATISQPIHSMIEKGLDLLIQEIKHQRNLRK